MQKQKKPAVIKTCIRCGVTVKGAYAIKRHICRRPKIIKTTRLT